MAHALNRIAAAFLFIVALPHAAAAQEADIIVTSDYLKMNWQKVSGQVPYGDLNLASDKGVETLKSRVKAEAVKLCGVGETTLQGKLNQNECYNSVMASAKPQIEKLAAVARAR